MATTHNPHSDLIHLFIDGEATDTERNILFGALKDSPELQEEFSSAMQLKQAFAADISKLQPPSYLQSQIAERAGLIVAATSSLATAPVVVNSVTSALTNVAPMAATGISKGLMTLVIGTSIGVLSTIGIIKLTSNESPKAAAPVISQNTVSQNEGSQAAPSLLTTDKPVIQSAPQGTYRNNRTTIALRSAAPLPVLHFSKAALNENSSAIAESKDREHTVAEDQSLQTETVNNNGTNTSSASENIAEAAAIKSITSTDPIIPVVKNVGSYTPNHNPLFNGSDGFFNEPDWMARVSVSYKAMPTTTAKLYQGQSDNATVPPWNNMGWGLKYELDPFNAIAVEGGLETFPVYLANSGGGYTGHHSIGWGGVSYTLSFPFAEVLNVHPEVRALAGMSTAGPIAKLSAGLVFQPYRQIGFSLAPEYTALFIKENGAVVAGNKLGLTYSMIFHF